MFRKRSIGWSVLLHVLLVLVLTVSVDFSPDEIRRPAEHRDIVQAKVIDSQAVAQEVERLKAAEERERRELERKRAAEEKRLADLKAEQERIKKAEAESARKRQEAERKAAEAERKAAEAEKRKAEAEREKAAAEQARREAEAEKQRRAEAEAEKKRQAEAEQKRQAEAERKRKEAAAREAERKRIEQALQDELAAEEAARQAAAQAAADATEIDRYVAAIAQRVRQSFTILPGLDGLTCTLRITLIPGGEVAGVQIVKSSGNPTFDRQAENAVRKAAPLPVPADPRLFQQMRSIAFVFDPS